jgi:glutathione synthase/RimK-type ligase-like ATP-grasp enzyme
MNHPAKNALAANKVTQLFVAREVGLRVPETLVTQSIEEARQFYAANFGRIIAKPLHSGTVETSDGQVESVVYTSRVREEHLNDPGLLARCPTLFQQELDKLLDIRVTVVDERMTAVGLAWPELGSVPLDIRRDEMRQVRYAPFELGPELRAAIRKLMILLGLRFGALDFVLDHAGNVWFLEINPNGQWAWIDIAGGFDIAASFVESFSRSTPSGEVL